MVTAKEKPKRKKSALRAIGIARAKRRLKEGVKSVKRDKGRLAKRVAPARPQTQAEIAKQHRWHRDPRRMDFEGVDAPWGTATMGTPTQAPAKKERPIKPAAEAPVTVRLTFDEVGAMTQAEAFAKTRELGFDPWNMIAFLERDLKELHPDSRLTQQIIGQVNLGALDITDEQAQEAGIEDAATAQELIREAAVHVLSSRRKGIPPAAAVPQPPAAPSEDIMIMGIPSGLFAAETVDGVRYETYIGVGTEPRSAVRVVDEDSGEVLSITQYRNFPAADIAHTDLVKKARRMSGEPDEKAIPLDLWKYSDDEWAAYRATLVMPDGKPDISLIGEAVKTRERQADEAAINFLNTSGGNWVSITALQESLPIVPSRIGGALSRLQNAGRIESREAEMGPGASYRPSAYRVVEQREVQIPLPIDTDATIIEPEGVREVQDDDDRVPATDRRELTATGVGVPADLPPERVSGAEEIRGTGRDVDPESGVREELRSELDREERGVRASSVELGDPREDTGDASGLELQQLEPSSPVSRGTDIILTRADLASTVSPAQRFDANLEAIRLVKRLETEGRLATPEEQIIIAQYSGFGDSAFNAAFSTYTREEAWRRRGDALRELASPDEYQAIERSRINAFYTTPEVVEAMWEGLRHLGADNLTQPRVLEPSAGSGRFMGLQPVDLAARSHRTVVELDTMTGAMLKHLYPNADTYVMGYQDAPIPNDSIDIAISNVPFGNVPVTDPDFRKGRRHLSRSIHNYFFAKTLDKLRPGGVMAFITSHHTLDAPTAKPVREALAERADLLAAVRLPKNAFPDTEVVTDIIFMRKRMPDEEPGDVSWVDTGEVRIEAPGGYYGRETIHPVNQYFLDNPEMVLGRHSASGTQYRRDEYSVEAVEGVNLESALKGAMKKLPANVMTEHSVKRNVARAARAMSPANVREGSYVITDTGDLQVNRGRELVTAGLLAGQESKVRGMLEIRDAAREVLNFQLVDKPDDEIKEAQQVLTSKYDTFVKDHGALNTKVNTDLMKDDPDGAFLRALEQQDGKQWEKMPIFSGRVVRGLGDRTAVATPRDALTVVLNETGGLDFERMGELLGRDAEDVRRDLAAQGAIYRNPVGSWETADQYLTGNVRTKLKQAEAAATANPAFRANVEALTPVLPEDLPPSQIEIQMGTPWIPASDVDAFITELVDAYTPWRRGRSGSGPGFFSYVVQTGQWVANNPVDGNRAKMFSEWGTQRMSAPEIIDRLLNSKPIDVFDRTSDGKSERNATETVAAQEKAAAIQARFKEWIWEDPERADRLARFYNDTFNNIRPRTFDGSHLTLPGMDTKWADQLHDHQKDAIWRVTQDGTALLGHEVGFGKSAIMVAGGMELRRLGLARKNLYVVPKATHPQFRQQFQDIYPYAKVLFPEQDDFSPSKRPELMARIATGDWDAVIVSDTQFRRIPIRPETEAAFLREELNDLRAAMEAEAAEGGGARSKTHKELQKALVRMEERLKEAQQRQREVTDDTMFFEDLGVDQMFVDEADMFKNLRFTTRMGRIKGLPNSDSQRAWDMYQKVRYLQKQGNGRGVVFATGTPIANTVAELYTNMRYLQQPMLDERGLQHFDAWAKTFGGTTEALEQTPTGAYRLTQRFAKFMNVPELSQLWQTTADIRVASEVPAMVKRQPILVDEKGKKGQRTIIAADASPELKDFMQDLARRADNLRNVDPTEDNMLKIASDARMASLDMRLVNPDAEADPDGKIALAIQKIADIYEETTPDKGTQLVFLDIGTPKAVDKVSEEGTSDDGDSETAGEQSLLTNVYAEIKRGLLAEGIPASAIAFIHDAKTNKAKNVLFEKVNKGDIRVLVGSTGKMGAGVNVQTRAAALHHLDAPWRPRDIEQREGRIIRQGNEIYGPKINETTGEVLDEGKGVRIYNYVTEGSFDAYMWQAIEAKAKAIRSLMRRNVTARTIEDVDSLVLSASEAKALASGNPDVMRAVQVKNDIQRLQMVKASHTDAQIRARTEMDTLPRRIVQLREIVSNLGKDKAKADRNKEFAITIGRQSFKERPEAGKVLAEILTEMPEDAPDRKIGEYRGFGLRAKTTRDGFKVLVLDGDGEHPTSTMAQKDITATGVIQRLENTLGGALVNKIEQTEHNLKSAEASLKTYREQADKPFAEQGRLERLRGELLQLERKLQGQEELPVADTSIESDPAESEGPRGRDWPEIPPDRAEMLEEVRQRAGDDPGISTAVVGRRPRPAPRTKIRGRTATLLQRSGRPTVSRVGV